MHESEKRTVIDNISAQFGHGAGCKTIVELFGWSCTTHTLVNPFLGHAIKTTVERNIVAEHSGGAFFSLPLLFESSVLVSLVC